MAIIIKLILGIWFNTKLLKHNFFNQDMTHVIGKNRKELLAMAKGHTEDKKGWWYFLFSLLQLFFGLSQKLDLDSLELLDHDLGIP